jgi:hypothetical protein
MRVLSQRLFLMVLTLVLIGGALSAAAQAALTPGAYYGFQSKSGQYISGLEGSDQIRLMPHLSGWEQWQAVDLGRNAVNLQSFQGTILGADLDRRVFQSFSYAHLQGFSEVLYFAAGGWSQGGGPDQVAIYCNMSSSGNFWVLAEQANGSLGITEATWGRDLPATAWWKVVPVPAPMNGRIKLKRGLQNQGLVALKSSHGSWLNQKQIPADQVTVLVQASTPMLFQVAARSDSNPNPVRFGQIFFADTTSQLLVASTHLKTKSGLWQVETRDRSRTNGGTKSWQIIDPSGRYKIGDPVPFDIPVALRNETGLYLSANPGYPELELSTSNAAWEHWVLSPP